MKNQYKRTDIFRCVHETHKGFYNRLSAFHILKEKKCFGTGCFYFKWSCKELSKRRKCHRGFSHVGRKCSGCRYYYEEKIHNYPELIISREEYTRFLNDLDEFEDWLSEAQKTEQEIAGVIDAVKPLFVKKVYPKASFLSFRGYMLIFRDAYLGWTHMEDIVYAIISGKTYQSLKLARGDSIEAHARLITDHGRLILKKLRRIQVDQRGEDAVWDDQRVLLARETATAFTSQPERCVQCPFGALVDVDYHKDHHSVSQRELLCLQGIKDHRNCYLYAASGGENRPDDAGEEECGAPRKIYVPLQRT